MFKTDDPRKTILFYIENRLHLATLKMDPTKGIQMQPVDNPIDFVNSVMSGDKGVCVNTDRSFTYFSVDKRLMKLKHGPQEDHILTVQERDAHHHYNF